MDIDELRIYRGQDYVISEYITIHQPTLNEICEYGEKDYYNMVNTLTSVGADLKWQLFDAGVDYTKITDFELFSNMLIRYFPQEKTQILFGNLDFTKFIRIINDLTNETCLIQQVGDNEDGSPILIIIDEYTYMLIVDYLRKMHTIKKNKQLPANEYTKQILIEDARDEYLRNKDKEQPSQLLNLISTMINIEGFKYNHSEVWSMKINAFMDSVKRISKIKNAELLLQSGYSGYGINLKEIDKKQLDWLGELD